MQLANLPDKSGVLVVLSYAPFSLSFNIPRDILALAPHHLPKR